MSTDITQAAFQSDVADSILDDGNIIAILPHQGNLAPQDTGSDAPHGDSQFDNPDDYFAEEIYAQEHDAQKLGDAGLRRKLIEEGEEVPEEKLGEEELSEEELSLLSQDERLGRQLATEERHEAETAQAQPLTPEQSEQVVKNINFTVEQLKLNEDAQQLEADFVNPEVLADTMSVATLTTYLSLVACDGDLSKLAPPSEEWATGAGNAYGLAIGTPTHDPAGVGRDLFYSIANLIHTRKETGSSDPAVLNSRENCVALVERLHKGITGQDVQVPEQYRRQFEQYAVDSVNKLTPYVLARLDKIRAEQGRLRDAQARQGQGGRSNTGRGRGQRIPRGLAPGIRGSKAPRFSSNRDIFSGPGFESALGQRL